MASFTSKGRHGPTWSRVDQAPPIFLDSENFENGEELKLILFYVSNSIVECMLETLTRRALIACNKVYNSWDKIMPRRNDVDIRSMSINMLAKAHVYREVEKYNEINAPKSKKQKYIHQTRHFQPQTQRWLSRTFTQQGY